MEGNTMNQQQALPSGNYKTVNTEIATKQRGNNNQTFRVLPSPIYVSHLVSLSFTLLGPLQAAVATELLTFVRATSTTAALHLI